MMRFLIDESVSKAVTQYLRDNGYDVLAVAEMTPQARDADILKWAAEQERILITSDKDFGELVFRSGQAHQGVVLFRLRDESAANQVRTLTVALNDYAVHLPGQFAVITEKSVRIRSNTPTCTRHTGGRNLT
jgi:predicted nuclease of predicted toxin-antitoxin system